MFIGVSVTYSYSRKTDGLQVCAMPAPYDVRILGGWGNSTSQFQAITNRG